MMNIKCKICGCEFPPVIDKHYVSRDDGRIGVFANLSKDEEKLYDTFDCPVCGCQVIAQERKRVYKPNDFCLEENEEEDDDE